MMVLWGLLLLLGVGFPRVALGADEPLAVVDGETITAEEIEKPLAAQLSKLEEQIYELKLQRVEALINEKLLSKEAAKRKITVQALLDAEVTAKVSLVTEQEIESFYQANKARNWCRACLIDVMAVLTQRCLIMARKPRVRFSGALYSGMRNSTPASASARLNSARIQGSSWAYGMLRPPSSRSALFETISSPGFPLTHQ